MANTLIHAATKAIEHSAHGGGRACYCCTSLGSTNSKSRKAARQILAGKARRAEEKTWRAEFA